MKIKMGNDEFILYIRKLNSDLKKDNDYLGKEIWIWLRNHGAEKTQEDEPCLWGDEGLNKLPKTATQFEFKISLLPELYSFLNFIVE